MSQHKIKKYYGKYGKYLKEHQSFFKQADLKRDTAFLISVLKMRKADKILDVACGQGRHANDLASKGFAVDGVDFSTFLIKKAKKEAALHKNKPRYFISNVEKLKLKQKYNKGYWFFADLAELNLKKALFSISKILKNNGLLLIDSDNIFRLLKYLKEHPSSNYYFDSKTFKLIDKKTKISAVYPSLDEWRSLLKASGFELLKIYGGYDGKKYSKSSQRLIVLAKKIA
jgi:SAM-dependent methyltransferase